MKTKRTCPKCDSKDIIRIEGSVNGYGAGNNIPMGVIALSYVKVPRYVCCQCGYAEEWIDLEDISKLKKKFK